MKPHELLWALMQGETPPLGPFPLARKIGKPMQSQIHRFTRGEVLEPARATAEPLAAYFKIPVEALYDERVATAIAKERGLEVVPLPSPTIKRTVLDPDLVKTRLAEIALWSDAQKEQLLKMLKPAAGIDPASFKGGLNTSSGDLDKPEEPTGDDN